MKGGEGLQGWIKDYRKELNSDIWMMPPLYHRVWQYLKYMANHEDKEIPLRDGSKFLIKKGQHLTSIRQIAQGVGWNEGRKWREPNPKTISSILKWLESQNMISINRGKGNRQYTLITIVNWEIYQHSERVRVTVNGEVGKQSVDINKNDKNEKNSSGPPDNSSHVGKISQLFHQSFITNPFMDEKLLSYLDDGMEPALIEKAIMITKENNKDVSYFWGILNRLLEREIKTIEQYEQAEREREERKRRENYEQGWERHRNDTGTDTTYQEEGYYSQLGIGRRI